MSEVLSLYLSNYDFLFSFLDLDFGCCYDYEMRFCDLGIANLIKIMIFLMWENGNALMNLILSAPHLLFIIQFCVRGFRMLAL